MEVATSQHGGTSEVPQECQNLIDKLKACDRNEQDLLMYLPLLRPTNEEGKKVYLQFLPVLVEDAIKQNLPVELVQQIFSYLLIHPAVKGEDRKILDQWLQKIQDHMTSGYQSSNSSSGISGMHSGPSETTSFMSNASSISSASSSSSASSTTWPTAVPQVQSNSDLFGGKKKISDQEQSSSSNSATTGTDEHHISFSKNGTEVDFEGDFLNPATTIGVGSSKVVHGPSTACERNELIVELAKIETWTFGKCEFFHWIEILDIFDEILEEATHYAEHPIYITCVSPQFEKGRNLLHLVLNFATLFIEHGSSRH